jgi:hypothetical protein
MRIAVLHERREPAGSGGGQTVGQCAVSATAGGGRIAVNSAQVLP